jgi:hypothetical protein
MDFCCPPTSSPVLLVNSSIESVGEHDMERTTTQRDTAEFFNSTGSPDRDATVRIASP